MDLDDTFRLHGPFLRRRDLLRLGHSDDGISAALRMKLLFRVRHGWYAQPGIADDAARAIRVGARLTGASALLSYGCIVPRPERVELVAPRNAARLRRPRDRRSRLEAADGCRIFWRDDARGDERGWRVTPAEALAHVLRVEPEAVAIACCDAALHEGLVTPEELDAVFAAGPRRARSWRSRVNGATDAHGETYVRLGCEAVGLTYVPHPYLPGVGEFDGRIGPHTYVEIDGIQHSEHYDGAFGGVSRFERDHEKDVAMAAQGDRVLRFTYRQIMTNWDACVRAMLRAVADDEALGRERRRRPYTPRIPRKRRSIPFGRPGSTRSRS
ncbi:DUF559 domain-containing protein [Galbitalea sp. SE-J8]|uniref:DUF559 domain-containing protein n=1 Tax=Galbitalea sp. SE-J8 TaxID=3054952 RepID=UPI00259CFB79|nr:DUF559 domain-containing protein [Galbitalea sp. SE-J8]MDM4762720.1 DUF559 domain-containing protein [Galbitalea sp. SE-J8]